MASLDRAPCPLRLPPYVAVDPEYDWLRDDRSSSYC